MFQKIALKTINKFTILFEVKYFNVKLNNS